jgi:hypothetical protein
MHFMMNFLHLNIQRKRRRNSIASFKNLAERGFDPRTSGLWAQHASTAPLCSDAYGAYKHK